MGIVDSADESIGVASNSEDQSENEFEKKNNHSIYCFEELIKSYMHIECQYMVIHLVSMFKKQKEERTQNTSLMCLYGTKYM